MSITRHNEKNLSEMPHTRKRPVGQVYHRDGLAGIRAPVLHTAERLTSVWCDPRPLLGGLKPLSSFLNRRFRLDPVGSRYPGCLQRQNAASDSVHARVRRLQAIDRE
jgi:hypothetical protein